MNNKIAVSAGYYTSSIGFATLPEGKTWGDVEDWYVKWDSLFVKFNESEDYNEFALDSDATDGTDWKRPSNVSIHPTDEDGQVDFDEELDGREC
jgi:hypothetical protein